MQLAFSLPCVSGMRTVAAAGSFSETGEEESRDARPCAVDAAHASATADGVTSPACGRSSLWSHAVQPEA